MALVVGDFLVAYLCRDDVWCVSGGLLPLLEYLALPLLVTLAVEIGVWLVLHLVHWWHRLVRLQTVLCAVRCVRYLVLNGVCVLELLLHNAVEKPCAGRLRAVRVQGRRVSVRVRYGAPAVFGPADSFPVAQLPPKLVLHNAFFSIKLQ